MEVWKRPGGSGKIAVGLIGELIAFNIEAELIGSVRTKDNLCQKAQMVGKLGRHEQIELPRLKGGMGRGGGFPQVPHPSSMMGKTRGFAIDPTPKLKSKNPRKLITGPPGIDMLCPPMSTSAAWATGGSWGAGAAVAIAAVSAGGAAAGRVSRARGPGLKICERRNYGVSPAWPAARPLI